MPKIFEKFLQKEEKESPEKIKEKKALELAKEIQALRKKPDKTKEDYLKIIQKVEQIKKIFSPERKEIIGWKLEGKLTEKDVLAEYQTNKSGVLAANFSPEGDKVVIGSGDNMMRVISLTEKDEEGKPKVLAEYEAGGPVLVANFSPEGDKVVIGGSDNMMRVFGPKEDS